MHDDTRLLEKIVHTYIAAAFSKKLRMFKPHKLIKRDKLDFIVFDLEQCDKNLMDLLFITLYDHRFSDDVYKLATALQPDRVRFSKARDDVAKMVDEYLTKSYRDMAKLPYLSLPYNPLAGT